MEKAELRMMEGPVIHGSTRIEKEPGKRPGEDSVGAMWGVNVNKKEVSPFNDLTDRDMATREADALCAGV